MADGVRAAGTEGSRRLVQKPYPERISGCDRKWFTPGDVGRNGCVYQIPTKILEQRGTARKGMNHMKKSNEKIFDWLDDKVSSATSKRPMFKLYHIGVVVRDLDEAVK